MKATLHRWTPSVSTTAVWHAVHKQPFCTIVELGDWVMAALSDTSEWWYQGSDWSNLTLPNEDIDLEHGPPFLEGLLGIISFDGLMHAWYAEYSVAYHKPSGEWYCWGTDEQLNNIKSLCIEERTLQTQSFEVDTSQPQHSMTKSEYCTAVEHVQAAIRQGNVYQINLAHQIGPFHIEQPLHTWLSLNEENPAKHACFWKTPTEILLCNSPELFLNISAEGQIESLPIKGTHGDIDNPDAYTTLWESPKERAELTMIVDMMRNDIGITAEYGSVQADERQIRQCGDLLHAEQRVHGQIRKGISTLQAVHACFPPASVTGAPKESAIRHIRELEPVNRRWYTGSFGFIDVRGHSTWNVLIRTLQGMPNDNGSFSAHLNIGAGIVYDSDPEAEWVETMAKGRAIERVIQQ